MGNLHYEVIRGGINEHLGMGHAYPPKGHTRGGVICFTDSGYIVGTLEWYVDRDDAHNAAGTFVSGQYQGRGIATEMWRLALQESGANEVHVDVVSDRGMTLAKSLERKFPKLHWIITDIGNRPLRVIDKRRGKKGHDKAIMRRYYHPGGF